MFELEDNNSYKGEFVVFFMGRVNSVYATIVNNAEGYYVGEGGRIGVTGGMDNIGRVRDNDVEFNYGTDGSDERVKAILPLRGQLLDKGVCVRDVPPIAEVSATLVSRRDAVSAQVDELDKVMAAEDSSK